MTQAWYSSSQLPPPAWYPDPSGAAELRYWDGSTWTASVVVDGHVTTRVMSPPPSPTPPVEPQLHLPPRALLVALVGMVVGVTAAVGLSLAGQLMGIPRLARLLSSQAGLWTGLVGAVWEVSRRFGTGRPLDDLRVRITGPSVGWGALMALGARFASGMAVLPVLAASKRFAGTNDKVFKVFRHDTASFVVVALLAVVGAPIVEELFFRGVVQGALLDTLGTVGAVAAQAVVFGLAHFNPLYGWANVTVIVAIGAAGVVLGITARRWGLGTSMFTHGFFNLVAVIATAALTR
ncbi:MAG: CPBP family glutamic-type intramembrane protease [Acidimicrobiales bacterium]